MGVPRESVAVVGAAVRAPGNVSDVDEYWAALLGRTDAITGLDRCTGGVRPPRDGTWRSAGVLADIAGFDADFFGISRAEAERMDPQQRLALEVAWEAVEDAGIPLEELRGSRTGVYAGSYNNDYLVLAVQRGDDFDAYSQTGVTACFIPNRISYHLDLRGPSMHVDTGCSSSLLTVHLAEQAIRAGHCDRAIVVGVSVIAAPQSTLMAEKVLPMAPGGRCRSFDSQADGIVRGEACGAVVLERSSLAERRRRRVRAVIRGSATNHDGRTNGITAPSARAQRELFEQAVADADVPPSHVGYIEAHGTGTTLGDPIEFAALSAVYGRGEVPCAVGTVKANIGHAEAAAGMAGFIKAVLVLEHGVVPGQPHFREPNPMIAYGGDRLTVPVDAQELAAVGGRRFAAVSSLGAGGANAHVILESAPRQAAAAGAPPVFGECLVLPLSARSPGALQALVHDYERLLDDGDDPAELCSAAMHRRSHHKHRLAVTGNSAAKLVQGLRAARAAGDQRKAEVVLVFGGQGSQWPGMGAELAGIPACLADLDESDRVVRELAGWSLMPHLLGSADPERIEDTEVAQVCIAAVELALAELLRSVGVRPAGVIGHSVGELPAAVVAGALDRRAMFEILLARAALAEKLARGGRMVSVELPEADLSAMIAEFDDVAIAAGNAPSSTVVAGGARSVDLLVQRLGERNAAHKAVPVPYGFHSPLLDGADSALAETIAHVATSAPRLPYYSTVTGQRHAEVLDADYWGRNLRDRVRFSEAVAAAAAGRPKLFVECSPHAVLSTSLHAIVSAAAPACPTPVAALYRGSNTRRGRPARSSLTHLLAALYQNGAEIDWSACFPAPSGHPRLPRYPWQHQRYWLDGTTSEVEQVLPPSGVEHPGGTRLGEAEIADFLRREVAAASGSQPATISDDEDIRALGIESMSIVQIRNDAERELGITVPLSVLLGGRTIGEIARGLHEALYGSPADDVERLLERIDDMDHAEVEAAILALEGKS